MQYRHLVSMLLLQKILITGIYLCIQMLFRTHLLLFHIIIALIAFLFDQPYLWLLEMFRIMLIFIIDLYLFLVSQLLVVLIIVIICTIAIVALMRLYLRSLNLLSAFFSRKNHNEVAQFMRSSMRLPHLGFPLLINIHLITLPS